MTGAIDGHRFLEQNEIAAETLTLEDVQYFANHHAGGLVVLDGYAADGRCVKMHDTWGPGDDGDGPVIVHTYDPDVDEDPDETVENFQTGREALDRFFEIIE